MKEYEIDLQYLEHDGGTKFYETVVISERVPGGGLNPFTLGPSILIQRWGKITQNTGAGATKIVKGNANLTGVARNKVLDDKRRMKPGKGQYLDKASPFFGLGRVVASGMTNKLNADAMVAAITEHYERGDAADVLNYFGYVPGESIEENDIIEEGNETDRGPQWASW